MESFRLSSVNQAAVESGCRPRQAEGTWLLSLDPHSATTAGRAPPCSHSLFSQVPHTQASTFIPEIQTPGTSSAQQPLRKAAITSLLQLKYRQWPPRSIPIVRASRSSVGECVNCIYQSPHPRGTGTAPSPVLGQRTRMALTYKGDGSA